MRFQNKIAIVTGGASDLGRDLAGLFIKEGGFVVIGDHIAARVDAVARKAGPTGTCFAVHVGGFTPSVTSEALVKATCDRFGRVDVLFDNPPIVHAEIAPRGGRGKVR